MKTNRYDVNSPTSLVRVYITYFNPHSTPWEPVTISGVRLNYSFLREHGGATGSVFFMHLNAPHVHLMAVKPLGWRVSKKLLYC
jgi:hypothetical protein